MKVDSVYTFIGVLLASITLSFGVIMMPVLAQEADDTAETGEEMDHEEEVMDDAMEHDEEMDHEVMTTTSVSGGASIEQMQALIAILQQLIGLLTQKVEMEGGHDHNAHDHEADHTDVLSISVEVHGDRTHVHVNEPGMDEVSFFLDDLDISDEATIITAIALETGLSETDIEAAVMFPDDSAMEHEHDEMEEGDDHDEEHDEEIDLDGLHIMSDGTVMLGNGEELEGATVTDDGMVMLEDGDLVEPEYDLR